MDENASRLAKHRFFVSYPPANVSGPVTHRYAVSAFRHLNGVRLPGSRDGFADIRETVLSASHVRQRLHRTAAHPSPPVRCNPGDPGGDMPCPSSKRSHSAWMPDVSTERPHPRRHDEPPSAPLVCCAGSYSSHLLVAPEGTAPTAGNGRKYYPAGHSVLPINTEQPSSAYVPLAGWQ